MPRKKVKTNHGQGKFSKEVKTFLFSISLVLTATSLIMQKEAKEPTGTVTIADDLEDTLEPLTATSEEIIEIVEDTIKETYAENDTISLTIPVIVTNENPESKREETDLLYGSYISEYSSRYGLPSSVVSAILTQERSDNPNDSELTRKNIGQLTTTAICGEKIIAPVFANGKLTGYDKIYVLPACYDDYPLEDLATMGHFPKFSEEEQQHIQTAIELQEGGYQIYRHCDAFYQTENNIKISTAYLAYIVNKKQDLIKGLASYNAGYTKITDDTSVSEILNGELENVDDANYLNHVFQYLLADEWENIEVYYEDGTKEVYSLIKEVLNEENDYHL